MGLALWILLFWFAANEGPGGGGPGPSGSPEVVGLVLGWITILALSTPVARPMMSRSARTVLVAIGIGAGAAAIAELILWNLSRGFLDCHGGAIAVDSYCSLGRLWLVMAATALIFGSGAFIAQLAAARQESPYRNQ
jgi:hypothetical protein